MTNEALVYVMFEASFSLPSSQTRLLRSSELCFLKGFNVSYLSWVGPTSTPMAELFYFPLFN